MLLVVDSFRCTCMYMHYRVSRSPVLLACDNCGLLWIFWWIKQKFLPCGELYLDQVRTIMEGVVGLNCGIWSDDPLSASVSSHPTIVCKFLYPALPITREYDVDAWKGEDYDTIKAYISLVCDVGKTSTLYRSPFTRPNHPTPHSPQSDHDMGLHFALTNTKPCYVLTILFVEICKTSFHSERLVDYTYTNEKKSKKTKGKTKNL